MNILLAMIMARALRNKRVDIKKSAKNMKRDAKFLVQVITELVQLINTVIRFVFVGVSTVITKCLCQRKTVEEEVKLPENVISLEEYKLKKAE